MEASRKQFTHVSNFTGYMAIVADLILSTRRSGLEILDIPDERNRKQNWRKS